MEGEILDFMLFIFVFWSVISNRGKSKCCKGLLSCYLKIPMSTWITEILQPAIKRWLLQMLLNHYKEYF